MKRLVKAIKKKFFIYAKGNNLYAPGVTKIFASQRNRTQCRNLKIKELFWCLLLAPKKIFTFKPKGKLFCFT